MLPEGKGRCWFQLFTREREKVYDTFVDIPTNLSCSGNGCSGPFIKFPVVLEIVGTVKIKSIQMVATNDDDFVIHLDEETVLTEDALRGILNFVSTNKHAIGQGHY